MEPAELETLVLAIKAVKDSPGGYGDVQLEFRKRWLVQASPRVSIKTLREGVMNGREKWNG